MVGFSSGLEISAERKCKSENKGLIQASWLSPYLCRGSFPMACLKSGHWVCTPPWPSCQHWAGMQSQQENLLLRLDQGGLLAASQPGSKTLASSWVCNLYPAWGPLFYCHLIGWFLSRTCPGFGNGPRNRNSLFLRVGIWHVTWRRGAQTGRLSYLRTAQDLC